MTQNTWCDKKVPENSLNINCNFVTAFFCNQPHSHILLAHYWQLYDGRIVSFYHNIPDISIYIWGGFSSVKIILCDFLIYPAGNYVFKVNNRNTRTRCEICSKLTIKTPERRHWRRSGVFIVNFENVLHFVLVLLLLSLSK